MGASHRRRGCRLTLSFITVTTVALLLLASVSALGLNSTRRLSVGSVAKITERGVTRRRLGGPGSSPPTCRSKCGRCWPCRPVHVPIQPGFSRPLEYYPEAWRCECGNKLFMP